MVHDALSIGLQGVADTRPPRNTQIENLQVLTIRHRAKAEIW